MTITRGIKAKLDKYGLNLPTDRRTRAYSNILKKNNWTEDQYSRYLKDVTKRYDTKLKSINKKVQDTNFRQKVMSEISEKNKVRHMGSILVQFLITKDRRADNGDRDGNEVSEKYLKGKPEFLPDILDENGAKLQQVREIHSIPFNKKVSSKKEINQVVAYLVLKLNNKIIGRNYVVDVEIEKQSQSIHAETNVPLENIRMKQSGSYMIDGYDKQEWDTNTNRCVYDYIIHRYGNVKGFKKACNYETLEEIFDEDNSMSEGVSTIGIFNFCQKFNICCHALDDEEKRFMHFVPIKRNQNAPAMMYRISNGHFYPVPEKKVKSILTINHIIDADCDSVYNIKKDDKKEKLPIENVVVLEDTNPMLEISKCIRETKTLPTKRILVKDGVIQSYELNNITYCINQNIPMTKKLCENMKIDYTGQSMGNILNLIIEETIKILPKSTHNPHVFETLLIANKNRTHNGLIDKSYEPLLNSPNTIARDINKCYTSIMYNPLTKWIRYDFNDCWEKYDGKLKLGLYYVRTDDTRLFHKSDIYSNSIIEKAMTTNIDFEIKYQLIPTYTEDKNMFRIVIDKILEYSKGDKNIYKLMINMISGMLAKTRKSAGNYKINKDINQIFQFLQKYPDLDTVIHNIPETDFYLYGAEKEMKITENNLGMYFQIIDQANIKLYDMVQEMGGTLIGRKVDCAVVHYFPEKERKIIKPSKKLFNEKMKKENMTISKCIRETKTLPFQEKERKIIKSSKKLFNEKMKKENMTKEQKIEEWDKILKKYEMSIVKEQNRIIKINNDNKPKLENSKEWGGNQECDIPVLKKQQEFKSKDYKFKVDDWKDWNIQDSDDWEKIKNILVNEGGLLLQADPGTGKTYTAKNIASVLDKVRKIAPTNKASLNLKGSTIHKFLNMDIEGNISTRQLNRIKRNYEYIIVDEISMITKELWRRLVFLKQATGVKFLLLGDDFQLPPVEDEKVEDYFNHPAVKYLCNNNRNVLKVTKRFDKNLKKELNTLKYTNQNIDISKYPFRDTSINIAYTHKTRKAVNKKWNDKLKPNDALFIPVREGDEKYGQDMYIYKELPLIARENDNKNGLYMNNETFVVSDYDNKYVRVYSERINDKDEVYINAMEVEIDKVQKTFYLNYCSTIHRVQGDTIKQAFTIWDWNHPCMSRKAKYTAMSRATCCENISIVGKYEEDDYNDKKIQEKLNSYILSDKEKGFDNDLTIEKVKKLIMKQNGTCNICNCDLKFEYSSNDRQQFSVDRIDSRIGHLCSNIQILCWGCNSSKGARF